MTLSIGQVTFGPDRSYAGWKQFEARRPLGAAGDALLIVRQTIPGAKTWDILHRYWDTPSGQHIPQMVTETLAQALSRREAKALAVRMLTAVVGIMPGGRILFKDGDRQ